MNATKLAKLYGHLTPWERFPLIVAAAARDDEAERRRLVDSAPRQTLSAPDHFELADAFRRLADRHRITLLSLAADYWRALYSCDTQSKDFEARLDHVLILGYLFNTYQEGWRQFCTELHIDPATIHSLHPSNDTLQRTERMAAQTSYALEGAERYVRDHGKDTDGPVTAADIAATLRYAIQHPAVE